MKMAYHKKVRGLIDKTTLTNLVTALHDEFRVQPSQYSTCVQKVSIMKMMVVVATRSEVCVRVEETIFCHHPAKVRIENQLVRYLAFEKQFQFSPQHILCALEKCRQFRIQVVERCISLESVGNVHELR